MSAATKRRTILAIVASDKTFARALLKGREVWVGKCLHCRARLVVGLDGEPESDATIEHILPRNHGGTDELPNLALACGPCNHLKGKRIDLLRKGDPKLLAVVEQLSGRRRERWREPDTAPTKLRATEPLA